MLGAVRFEDDGDGSEADAGATEIDAADAAAGRPATAKLDIEDIGDGNPEMDAGAGGKLGRPAVDKPLEFKLGPWLPTLFPA